jgi:hypothetical protein
MISHATKSVAKAGEDAATEVQETLADLIRTSQDQAIARFEQMLTLFRPRDEQIQQFNQLMTRNFDELAAMGRQHLDAALTVNRMMARSTEVVWRELDTFYRAAADKGLATVLAALDARSLDQLVAIQSDYMRESVDRVMSESGKLQRMTIEATDEIIKPLKETAQADEKKVLQTAQRMAA